MEALVLWEVSKKQEYIFSSNKLKENKGASIIIEKIIEELPFNINQDYKNNAVYYGGGSSLYKFNNRKEAKNFIKRVSEKVLREYPGVEIFMVVEDYDENNIDSIENAYKKLAAKKNKRSNSGHQISFGIEKICSSTGLPASEEYTEDTGGEKRYRSEEVMIKHRNSQSASAKFYSLLRGNNSCKEFSDLAKGDKKYLAVVHIDGNKMGKKFEQLKENFQYSGNNCSKTNKDYLKALKQFSDNVKKAYENAFKEMSRVVELNSANLENETYIKENRFPIIPIIVAGDDITYVTNGKIGIETARIFIEYLYKNEIEIYNGKKIRLNACAGVSIAKITHPFAKTYELAEDLCSSAKRRILIDFPDSEKDFSLIDWHIEQGDLMGTIQEIRDEHYITLDKKQLAMRPLFLNNPENWRSYKNFKAAYHNITNREINENKIARNKLKELREILKKGEADTEIFLKLNNIDNYFSRFDDTAGDYCFFEDNCMYYDAIEVMDLYIELNEEGDKNE